MRQIFTVTVLNLVDTERCRTTVFTDKNSFKNGVEKCVAELADMGCYCSNDHLDWAMKMYQDDISISFTSDDSGKDEFVLVLSTKYV